MKKIELHIIVSGLDENQKRVIFDILSPVLYDDIYDGIKPDVCGIKLLEDAKL